MKALFLAAALAAIAAPLPAAPGASAESGRTIGDLTHIRTNLSGDKGPAVILIPGMSTPSNVWDDMSGSLATGHRVLVVEVKGFDGGRAPANESDGLIEGIVADIASDIAARGLEKPVIAGHSFGGLVAMRYALAHPEEAKSIVVVDALPFFGTVFSADATVESIAPRAKSMRDMMIAQADVIRAAAAKGVTRDPGGNMSIDPVRRTTIADWSVKADPAVVAQALVEDMAMDLRKEIAGIRVPMTVLYQAHEDEAAATIRYKTDYAAKPDTRLVPVKDTGHFIQLDQPQVVREAILSAAR